MSAPSTPPRSKKKTAETDAPPVESARGIGPMVVVAMVAIAIGITAFVHREKEDANATEPLEPASVAATSVGGERPLDDAFRQAMLRDTQRASAPDASRGE